MITAELRRAISAAAGPADGDPLLRPGRGAGELRVRPCRSAWGRTRIRAALAARLSREPWIERAELTGRGYLTVTVTHDALAGLAVRIARAGPACAASDALRGRTVPAAPPADPGRAELAAGPGRPRRPADGPTRHYRGRDSSFYPERDVLPPPVPPHPDPAQTSPVAAAVRYAGADEVRFALARMPPGGRPPEAAVVARHVLTNPAYAVRYAHAAAAAVLRWAAALGTRPAGFRPRLLAEPGELALLDALSWLPERVAMAARRGRPDEFAGYLEELAARTIGIMNTTGFTTISSISSERLWLADAARTGLAAGLGLLGVSAPGRL